MSAAVELWIRFQVERAFCRQHLNNLYLSLFLSERVLNSSKAASCGQSKSHGGGGGLPAIAARIPIAESQLRAATRCVIVAVHPSSEFVVACSRFSCAHVN